MYEKQKSVMDTNEMIFDSEISTATPAMFVEMTTMAVTPTTLAAFEELSSELITSQAIPTNVLVSKSSGNQFWPGSAAYFTEDMFEMDDDSSLDSNSNFTSAATNGSSSNPSSAVSVKQGTRSAQQQREVCAVKPVEQKQRKLPGPRPSKPIEEMTPIEAERRRRRRERNKNAAAKCRQRRLEVTNELLAETEKLEREATKLEREIENLRRVKNQLEFVLESHKPICTAMPPITDADFISDSAITTTNSSLIPAATSVSNVCVVRPNNLPLPNISGAGNTSICTSTTLEGVVFSFDTPTAFSGLTPLLSAAGDLNSPSAFNLFSP